MLSSLPRRVQMVKSGGPQQPAFHSASSGWCGPYGYRVAPSTALVTDHIGKRTAQGQGPLESAFVLGSWNLHGPEPA